MSISPAPPKVYCQPKRPKAKLETRNWRFPTGGAPRMPRSVLDWYMRACTAKARKRGCQGGITRTTGSIETQPQIRGSIKLFNMSIILRYSGPQYYRACSCTSALRALVDAYERRRVMARWTVLLCTNHRSACVRDADVASQLSRTAIRCQSPPARRTATVLVVWRRKIAATVLCDTRSYDSNPPLLQWVIDGRPRPSGHP